MPNWCYNEIYFVGGTEEQRKNLFEKIKDLNEHSPFKDASQGWIGNLSIACGIPFEEVNDEKSKYRARAFIQDVDMDGDYIRLNVESAWSPIDEYLKDLFDAGLSSLEGMRYVYSAEEFGNDIWVTNDVDGEFFSLDYYLDTFDGPIEPESFVNEEQLLKFVNSEEFQKAYMTEEKDFHSYEEVKDYAYDNDCEFTVRKMELDTIE